MTDWHMPIELPTDIDPFMFYALSLHAHAVNFGNVCNADGSDIANGLMHALAIHLSRNPAMDDEAVNDFVAALPELVREYRKSTNASLLVSSSTEQDNDNNPTTEPPPQAGPPSAT
jgi:hypothetical protein